MGISTDNRITDAFRTIGFWFSAIIVPIIISISAGGQESKNKEVKIFFHTRKIDSTQK